MATNSYQGVNGVQGVNSFGGGNSFTGTNSNLAPADSRNIQASNLTDSGLRSLLADQFKPVNSYSKLGVAPIGALNSVLAQYSQVSPEDVGKLSVADEFNALKPSGTLDSGNKMYGKSTLQSAIDAYNSRIKTQGQSQGQASAATAAQPVWNAPQAWAVTGGSLYQDPKYANTKAISKPLMSYDDINKLSQKYYSAGFKPGNQVDGWTYTPGITQRAAGRVGNTQEAGGGLWERQSPTDKKTQQYISYSPAKGYGTSMRSDETGSFLSESMRGIGPVASVIGGIVLPGLGTSVAGLLSNAGSDLGISLPSFSSSMFGVPSSYASMLDPVIGKAATGALSSGLSGGNVMSGALGGALNGALGSALGAASNALPENLGLASKLAGSTSMGALNAILKGGNAGQGALSGLLGGGLSSAGAPSQLASITNKLIAQKRKNQNV